MKAVPYASALGSLMYAILCTRPDIYYVVGMINIYQSNPKLEYWTIVKYIFKYLRRTRDYLLTYEGSDLIPIGYTDSISCQPWILESQLPSMYSQGLRAHRTEISPNMGDSMTCRRHSY